MLFALYRVLRWCSYSIQICWVITDEPVGVCGRSGNDWTLSVFAKVAVFLYTTALLDAQFWSSWWRLFIFSKGDRDASAICKVYIHAHALIGYGFYRSNFRRGVRLYRRRSSWTGWKCVRAFMWRSFRWRDVYVASPGSAHLKQSEVNL